MVSCLWLSYRGFYVLLQKRHTPKSSQVKANTFLWSLMNFMLL